MSADVHAKKFKAKHQHILKSDGVNTGLDSHALILNVLGKKSIETPDLYESNHTEVLHIFEDEDGVVGPHFVFLSHRDHDSDRDKGKTDRQRNEIKVHDKSNPELRAFHKDKMEYRWKFKIDDDFEFSKSFTHFFQIKAKNVSKKNSANGGESYPLITFTVAEKGGNRNEFQVRYSAGNTAEGKATADKIIKENMSLLTGKWVEFIVQVTYKEKGKLRIIANDVETGETLIDFKQKKLDLWRGEGKKDFARPKWGIYRSLKNKDSLRPDEEVARFADFSISKGK